MAANIIDGKAVSAQVKAAVAAETAELAEKGIIPGLAVVIVGDDPASRVYVNNKKKACAAVGFHSEEYALPADTSEEQLLALVERLNQKPDINGILVQLPLPEQIDEHKVIAAIAPEKDVDAFHAANVGKIMIGDFDFLPCTPSGCMDLIHSTGVEITGKKLRRYRQKQYCRKAYGHAPFARERHGNDLSFQDKELEGNL